MVILKLTGKFDRLIESGRFINFKIWDFVTYTFGLNIWSVENCILL